MQQQRRINFLPEVFREFDEAKAMLRQALEHSKHEQTYVVLGKVFLMTSDVPGAVGVYKEAVK